MHFCPKGRAICKISEQIIKTGKSLKSSHFVERYVNLESCTCLMNSFKFIHSLFLPNSQKGPFLSFVIQTY